MSISFAQGVSILYNKELIAGTGISFVATDTTITINATGGGGGTTNLAYVTSSRTVTNDNGTGFVLPIVTATDAGLAPLSGGGTTNFLRADGTWVAPPGGGGGGAVKATTVTIPYGTTRRSVTVVDAAITPSTNIIINPGAVLNTDENDPEMDEVRFFAVAGTGDFLLTIATAGHDRLGGAFKINYTYGT